MKNEQEWRDLVLEIQHRYLGCKTGDAREKDLVDTYNSHKPLPRNYKVTYKDNWCATDVSAIAIKAATDDITPIECGCGEMVNLAKGMGIWKNASYNPQPGDIVMYDWTSKKDGWADHTGFVEVVGDNYIQTIEGNTTGGVCARRTVLKSDSQILGYIAPRYDTKPVEPEVKIGTVTTAVNLRTSPINLGFLNKCKVDRNDGKGIRSVLYTGETAPIIAEKGNWYQLEIKGAVYTWTPWATKSAIKEG